LLVVPPIEAVLLPTALLMGARAVALLPTVLLTEATVAVQGLELLASITYTKDRIMLLLHTATAILLLPVPAVPLTVPAVPLTATAVCLTVLPRISMAAP